MIDLYISVKNLFDNNNYINIDNNIIRKNVSFDNLEERNFVGFYSKLIWIILNILFFDDEKKLFKLDIHVNDCMLSALAVFYVPSKNKISLLLYY